MCLPPHGSSEVITWRLRHLLGAKTFEKHVAPKLVAAKLGIPAKGNKYPCFVALASPDLRNTGTLLAGATLTSFVSYRRESFSTWDVCYNPVSDEGRVSVWWVRGRKEERKLLKGYITQIYAPEWFREIERNKAERKLSARIMQLALKR